MKTVVIKLEQKEDDMKFFDQACLRIFKADNLMCVLWDFSQYLHEQINHCEDDKRADILEEISKQFWEYMDDQNIDFDELWS